MPSKQSASSNLCNHLLIAMPGMEDPNFAQTVTLICEHNEEGSFGVTLNRPVNLTVGELFSQLKIDSIDQTFLDISAVGGGPVHAGQGFVLHSTGRTWEGTLKVSDMVSVTSSRDILDDIAAGDGPDKFLLALGCASWEAGQLDEEILQNEWLTCPADSKIIFDTPHDECWKSAAQTLGIDVYLMSDTAGHA
jgi:putative transcriptional regulator